MAATYFTLLTKVGQAKIVNAIALGQNVAWTTMAVGDGNGNPTTPNENQTALVRENYRAGINQLTVDPDNPNYMVAELVVPTNVGGWTVYEVGVFDADGDMIAVANFPATYKPQLVEGSGRDLVVRIIVQVSNASIVTLKVDPAMVLASQKWVVDNFVRKVTVAGGTTGQVLAKASNANESFKWIDPTAAVSVLVDAKPERQTLADLQTVVNLALLTTQGLAVYIEGARLIETIDYVVNSNTQFTMARSYPAGSRIHMYQNDPTSLIADATETQRGFIHLATTAQALAMADDANALTPKKLAAAFSGSNRFHSSNGFQKLPGGLILQWGVTGASNASGIATFNFPVAFPVACLAVYLTEITASGSGLASVRVVGVMSDTLSKVATNVWITTHSGAPAPSEICYAMAIGV